MISEDEQFSGLYYKHIMVVMTVIKQTLQFGAALQTNVIDDCKHIMIVNDDCDMFIVQATMGMIVNYKCNTFIVQSDAFLPRHQ